MPANTDLKKSILTALNSFEKKPLADAARGLLNTLGYQSNKTLKITPNTAEGFQAMFGRQKLMKAKACLEDWLSVDLLFQVSEAEIQASLNGQGNFTAAKVDNKDIRSYLFFAVELKDQQYTRTQLSGITREINRLFESIPALIVFKHGGMLSVGIIARRLSKKDNSKDVLEKVTIIKDISFASPHRAHVEILLDLSIGELQSRVGFSNFGELQKAWEQVLNTSALNKKFFREVADWYFWAVDTVRFPKDVETQMSVIRLITRLIFVWFIKEKGLVPPELFDERKLKELLYFNDPQKSSYYKAILQNLFFATLNTEMGVDRKFRSKNKNPNGLDGHHGVTTLYRYEDQFKAPKEALKLFANIPFLNGGLFECLDKSEEKIYIDGFSDTPKNQPVVPDELFFGAEQDFDLNEIYDTKNRKYKVRGLINIFNDYKFTIEENTPIEEEIALDPELLGKVFENLLAAYNPETGSTARKQTGSFYTPREIVNYMVDEALIAYLESSLKDLTGVQNLSGLQDKLRRLFAYNNQAPLFNEAETLKLIEAINNLKAFDPACGSGAFPMGMLHKLVHLLGKLDPDNKQWRELQKQKAIKETEVAYNIGDVEERRQRLQDIDEAFENNSSIYGRKLYIIENCIYGADIQPIAVQIAKLRFFISLVVEQEVDNTKPNRGIRPLPNLETKFVAANTLISIEEPKAGKDSAISFVDHLIEDKRAELKELRHKIFRDRNPKKKKEHREQDKLLRSEIAEILKPDWGKEAAEQLASWDPYNQNAHADFFDPEWMFGIEGGFDVVIGNPPYINIEKILFEDRQYLLSAYGEDGKLGKRYDLYQIFILKGMQLLRNGGLLCYILPNTFLMGHSYTILRKRMVENTLIKECIDLPQGVFESATVDNVILCLQRESETTKRLSNKLSVNKLYSKSDVQRVSTQEWDESFYISQSEINDKTDYQINLHTNAVQKLIFEKIESVSVKLGDVTESSQGIILYKTEEDANQSKYTGSEFRKGWKKLLRGKNIGLYTTKWGGEYVNYGSWLWSPRDEKYFQKPKILLQAMRNKSLSRRLVATLDTEKYYNAHNLANIIELNGSGYDLKYILGVFNSTVINFWYKAHFPNVNINPNDFRQIPIRKIDSTSQKKSEKIMLLVDKILAEKRANPQADTSKWEAKIYQLVYQLYGLTEDEVKIVEGRG